MQCVWVLLIFLPTALSHKFKVEGPDAVAGVAGSDVVLPCSVRDQDRPNRMNAENLNVTWSRSDLKDSKVHFYGNHKDLNTDQNPSYRGRTALFKEDLKNGNVSLKLSNVRVTNEGVYTCRVDSKYWEDHRSVYLSVEVIGSKPEITVKYELGKFSLLCESSGWRPEPVLQWRTSKGVNLTAETETQTVCDSYNLKSRITVEEIDSFSCTVTQKNHEKEGQIDAQILREHVPNPGRTAGIIIGVIVLVVIAAVVGVFLYIRMWKRRKEIEEVTSLLNSGRDACLQYHDLSDRQWDHVVKTLLKPVGDERLLYHDLSDRQSDHPEETLLKSEEERKEFNLRKYDPSDRGVEKLQRVIAASTHIQLENCGVTVLSCIVLAKVLQSVIELNLSQNKLLDLGVKILWDGLKSKNCKLQILRLVDCNLSELSCIDLASVLRSKNSLIELNLSENRLEDTGVEILCDGLKNENCKLQILRLVDCNLSEISCAALASVLRSKNSLIELNLSENRLEDTGVEILCDGLKNENCKLQILRLDYCYLSEKSCEYLASVLQSENSTLRELNLNKNILKDSGVKKLCGEEKLCDGLKSKNCKLQILRLEDCNLSEKGCEYLASVLQSENSTLIELNLNKNKLKDSGVKKLCDGLKNNNNLQKLRLENCNLSEGSCEYLASVLQSVNPLRELNLNKNNLRDTGVKKLCEGLNNNNKLQKLRLTKCGIADTGCEYIKDALTEDLQQNPSSPLKELDLSDNPISVTGSIVLSELEKKFPTLTVKLA